MSITFDDIEAAHSSIADTITQTPLVPSPVIGHENDCEVWLKLETFHPTGSFKERGALYKLRSLSAKQRQNGVIAMSAGNHAQGVAFHAQRLGIPSTIVMPDFAPFSKVQRTKSFGARVVQTGDTLDASGEAAMEIAARENLTFVHPFDDPYIIAGQGTIALEMLRQNPDLDTIIVPIGGGGLISGIAIAAKALKPSLAIIGVETTLYPSAYAALHQKNMKSGGATIADGIAVKQPGKLTLPIISELVDDILLVEEAAIESAIVSLAERQKTVAEGAGAIGLAALASNRDRFRGQCVGLVICGGNIDIRLLSSVLVRGLVSDGRLVRLRIKIIDRPGVLAKLSQIIGSTGANIIEVHHQRLFADIPAKEADVDITMETRDHDHVEAIIALLVEHGFPSRELSSTSFES